MSLARRCVDDQAAREQLFRRHAQSVYRLARRLLGDSADAEDVMHEVFIQVLASIDSYRGEAALSSWLHRVTVRSAMRFIKRRRSRREVNLELVGEPAEHPEPALARRAALRGLNELLGKIAVKRRVIFVLYEVEGYSLAEAAAIAGVSETAAKKLVWRARQDLQKLARKDPRLQGLFTSPAAKEVRDA